MNIGEAAAATLKYKVWRLSNFNWAVDGKEYLLHEEAQAACDRLNLLAVLACIREGSDAMCAAGSQDHKDAWGPDAPIFEHSVYRAMIDALIAEVKE